MSVRWANPTFVCVSKCVFVCVWNGQQISLNEIECISLLQISTITEGTQKYAIEI